MNFQVATPLYRGNHVRATYRTDEEPSYRGNPLIEALPALASREEIVDQTKLLPPPPTAAERQLDPHIRQHRLANLARFKIPLRQDLDLYERLQNLLRTGYEGRNPLAPGAWEVLDQRAQTMSILRAASAGQPHQLTVLGISGVGKSLALKANLAPIPQTIAHLEYAGKPFIATQVPWLRLDCPHDASARGLCVDFFAQLDAVLASLPGYDKEGYAEESLTKRYVSRSATTDDLLIRMARVAGAYHLGLLALDEIQVLNEARSGGASQLLNFLLKLVNTMGVPVVLIGTYKAYPLLATQLRLARRAEGNGFWDPLPLTENVTIGSKEYKQPGEDWAVFTSAMWRYQYTRAPIPYSKELLERLHEESQGIPDIAIKLFALVQRRAIQLGAQGAEEVVTKELITAVAETELRLVRPLIIALRERRVNPELLARLDDVIPPTLESLLQVRPLPDVRGMPPMRDEFVGSPGRHPRDDAKCASASPITAAVDQSASADSPAPPPTGNSPTTAGKPKRTKKTHPSSPSDPALGPTLRDTVVAGQRSGVGSYQSLSSGGHIDVMGGSYPYFPASADAVRDESMESLPAASSQELPPQ